MSVHAHCQRTAVFVAEPAAHSGDIHAGLDAGRGKVVPEIMVCELRIIQTSARGLQALLGAVDLADGVAGLGCPFITQAP